MKLLKFPINWKLFSGAGYISRRKKILSVCISHYNLKEKIIIVYVFMWIVKSEISFSTSLDDYDQSYALFMYILTAIYNGLFLFRKIIWFWSLRKICFIAVQPYRKARNTKQSWSKDKNLFQGFLWDHGTVSRSTFPHFHGDQRSSRTHRGSCQRGPYLAPYFTPLQSRIS